VLAQHVIQRIREIRHRVDQRAVEVEDQQKIGHSEEVCAALFIIRNNLCVGLLAEVMQPLGAMIAFRSPSMLDLGSFGRAVS